MKRPFLNEFLFVGSILAVTVGSFTAGLVLPLIILFGADSVSWLFWLFLFVELLTASYGVFLLFLARRKGWLA